MFCGGRWKNESPPSFTEFTLSNSAIVDNMLENELYLPLDNRDLPRISSQTNPHLPLDNRDLPMTSSQTNPHLPLDNRDLPRINSQKNPHLPLDNNNLPRKSSVIKPHLPQDNKDSPKDNHHLPQNSNLAKDNYSSINIEGNNNLPIETTKDKLPQNVGPCASYQTFSCDDTYLSPICSKTPIYENIYEDIMDVPRRDNGHIMNLSRTSANCGIDISSHSVKLTNPNSLKEKTQTKSSFKCPSTPTVFKTRPQYSPYQTIQRSVQRKQSQCTLHGGQLSLKSQCTLLPCGYDSCGGSSVGATMSSFDVRNNSRGQLKLSVAAVANNTLQVQVIEAANLHSRWKDLCDPYIQLQICPDESNSGKHQTQTLAGTNNPYYDALVEIPVNLGSGDKQRLVVSAWHRDNQKNCSEFLGCMSFGVKHLLRKVKRQNVEGWYHLLPDNLGHRKHLSVESAAPPRPITSPQQHPIDLSRLGGLSIGGVNLGAGVPYSFTLHHEGRGYGFTVRGSCPVRVGRVKEHGPAHQAGIRHGDFILNINAVNVTRSRAESVAAMVKKCGDSLTIDMYRRNKKINSSVSSSRSCASSLASSIPSIDLNYALIHSDDNDENTPPVLNESLKRRVIGSSCRDLITEEPRVADTQHTKTYHVVSENNNLQEKTNSNDPNIKVWDPEVSPIGRSDPSGRPQLKNYVSIPSMSQLTTNSPVDTTRVADTSWAEDIESLNGDMSYIEDYATTDTELPWNPDCSAVSQDFSGYPDNVHEDNESLESSRDQSQMITGTNTVISDTGHQQLSPEVEALVHLQLDFSKSLNHAIQAYSHPLRHCHISPRQHQCLFQNMEKMSVISSFIAKQLEREDAVDVYCARASMICDSLETYIQGLPLAQTLLDELQKIENFEPFLSLTAQDHGIELQEVLTLPVQHFESLIHHLQAVISTSADGSKLFPVISALRSLNKSPSCPPTPRSNNSVMEAGSPVFSVLSQTFGPDQSRLHEMSHTSRHHSRSYRMNSSLIAPDILDLQKRLVIPRHLKKFKLASSQRHLIYSGELMRIQDGCSRRLFVLLLSDLLLVTKEMDNSRLHLTEEPILLDALHTEWETQNDCKFILHWISSNGDQSLALHTDNPQQKCVWQSILDHRISLVQEADKTRQILDIL